MNEAFELDEVTDLHVESDLPTRLILKTALEWVVNRGSSIDEQFVVGRGPPFAFRQCEGLATPN